MTTYTLTITFLSDWHVGEGAGSRGYIDRIIRRDPQDGLPYVPAKTLTGMLRDGCERLAQALDGGAPGAWSRFVQELFGGESRGTETVGQTTPARLRLTPARLPPALRAALARKENAPLAQALVSLRPGVRIDANGTAAHDMLRIEEVASAGAVLGAELILDDRLDPDARCAAEALLAGGARLTERLGGKRRRGHGRCRITLENVALDTDRLLQPPPALQPPAPGALRLACADAAGDARWLRHRLRLVLLEPLQIPLRTLGNFVPTRDHVPGSLLLAALDPLLRSALGAQAVNLTGWLAEGALRVSFAYPEAGNERGLPVPLCLEQGKLDKRDLRNLLAGSAHDAVQRKPLRAGYVTLRDVPQAKDEPQPIQAGRVNLTHATIDDACQRPNEAVGGVFTYEAVAPGQTLQAEIVLDANRVPLKDLAFLEGREVRLGRSKKDDYGRARIACLGTEDIDPPTGERERITLWLTAPAIIRDALLEPVTDAEGLARYIASLCGIEVEVEAAYYRLQREDGWRSRWREPFPTQTAFAPGSVFVLSGQWNGPALARLSEGLGERRGEGYGEVVIDPPLLAGERPPIRAPGEAEAGAPTNDLLCSPSEWTQALHRRAWLDAVRQAAWTEFDTWRGRLGWSDTAPGNAQLGALREQMLHFDPERFGRWLNHLEAIPNRRDKWPEQSRQELARWSQTPGRVWQVSAKLQTLPLLPGHDRAALQEKLGPEAARLFWLTLIGLELDRREQAEGVRADTAATETSS